MTLAMKHRFCTVLLIVFAVVSASAVGGNPPDAWEPDDNPASAQANLIPGCDRSFHQSSDEDWIAFFFQRTTHIDVTPGPAVDLSDDGTGTGITLELLRRTDSGGVELVQTLVSQPDAGPVSLVLMGLAPDFYYLRVLQCRNTEDCNGNFPTEGAGYCLSFAFTFTIPSPGVLSGTVRDLQTGLPIGLALVETSGNAGTFSNLSGQYGLSDGQGDYTAYVEAPGYLLTSFPFSLFPLATTTIDVSLTPQLIFDDGFESIQ